MIRVGSLSSPGQCGGDHRRRPPALAPAAPSGASGGQRDATTSGNYNQGMAVFTIAKGGLMYAAAIAGQKFTYKPL